MNVKMKYFNFLGLAASLIIILSGCYPKGPEFIQDFGIVVTDYDPDFDFGSRKTYYMPDTIHLETNMDIEDVEDRLRELEALILDLVEENMEARNYDRIDTTSAEAPDLVVTVTAYAFENAGVGWVPGPGWGWWGGYYPPGWWGPGWGWYYPGWYPVGYSYNTGTVIMHMGDPDVTILEDDVHVAWVGALDGILSSSESSNTQGITNGINQAFTQSPYIQSN